MWTRDCQESGPSCTASNDRNGMNSLSHDSIVPLVDESNQPIAHMKGFL